MRLTLIILFAFELMRLGLVDDFAPDSQRLLQYTFTCQELFFLSMVLWIWALNEAVLLVKQRSEAKKKAQNTEAAPSEIPVPTANNSSNEKANLSLLENERDELRQKNTELTLNQKELEQQLLTVKAKVKTLELAKTEQADQNVLAEQAVLSFLGTLQDKGRLIDFLMDDISPYTDQQVGAAARVVHQGCNAVLKQQLSVSPIFKGQEGTRAQLERDYSPSEWRLMGAVKGQPPFQGSVLHRGWKAERVALSRPTGEAHSVRVLAPAELEIG